FPQCRAGVSGGIFGDSAAAGIIRCGISPWQLGKRPDLYVARAAPGSLGGGRCPVPTARAARHRQLRIHTVAWAPWIPDAAPARPGGGIASVGIGATPTGAAGAACLWLRAQSVLRLCAP